MRKRAIGSLTCNTLMTVFVGVLILVAFRYTKEVRLVPFVIGFPTLILLIILLIGEFYPKIIHVVETVMEDLWGGKFEGQGVKKKGTEFTEWRPVLGIIGWAIMFYGFLFLFGFVLVPPFFIAGFLIRKAGLNWLAAFFYSLIATIIIYAGMTGLLNVDLWQGAIPTMIPGILGGSIVPPL